jgi:excisionase family DNA binding protein
MKGQGINNPVSQKLNKRLYTIEEAAEYLGRTPRAVRDMIYAGKLHAVKIDRRTQIDIDDMNTLIDNSKDQCFN